MTNCGRPAEPVNRSTISGQAAILGYLHKLRGSKANSFLQRKQVVLSSNTELEKSDLYSELRTFLGNGLLTSGGNRWKRQRRLCTPTFHFYMLKTFMPTFNEQSEILIRQLAPMAVNSKFDIYPFISFCVLDILSESAMGCSLHSQLNNNSNYAEALSNFNEIIREKSLKIWLKIPLIFKLTRYAKEEERCLQILHDFADKIIEERSKMYNEYKEKTQKETLINDTNFVYGQKHRKAFLDTLLEESENGNGLSKEELRNEVNTFMFAGHDTTSAAIGWVIHFVAWCPSIQDKVHEEIDKVFGASNRQVTEADLYELKYLEATIKESLRMAPAVFVFGRKLLKEIDISGYKIPEGAQVLIASALIHMDENIFLNPMNFDPTRFFKDELQARNPYGYLPFSAGPRNCIGQRFALMEEKVILASIFRNFSVRTATAFEDIDTGADLTLQPRDGIHVYLEKRKQCSKN